MSKQQSEHMDLIAELILEDKPSYRYSQNGRYNGF